VDTPQDVPAPSPRPRLELWQAGYQVHDFDRARRRSDPEAEGWDGQMAMDSQSLSADPYVVLAELATRTTKLLLGTSVTNPVTRHLAVTASAMVSLQALSGGRAVLGIGRGDSSLAFVGRAPLDVEAFERSLLVTQAFLRGEPVPFEAWAGSAESAELASIELGRAPEAAQLRWIPAGLPKVPLDVAATGPRVIGASARIAERVTVSVGAIPERVAWAVDVARSARSAAGLDAAEISIGAQLIVIPHADRDCARRLATDLAAPLARFSTINGRVVGPTSPSEREVFDRLRAHYDMTRHGAGQTAPGALTAEFVDRFAIVGPPDDCVTRLAELVELGLDRMIVCGPTFLVDPPEERRSRALLVEEVLPALRATTEVNAGGR
jgi:5,10-methylenetetrahydromethanopterin reductase